MAQRRTETATERIKRHHARRDLGERLITRGLDTQDMDLDELQAVKTAYLRRLVAMRGVVARLDPRSAKRKPVEHEASLITKLLDHHVQPALARALHTQVMAIIDEYRLGATKCEHPGEIARLTSPLVCGEWAIGTLTGARER